ncbi:MAG: hypothetical protein MJ154_01615 [Candidatus Saccharibacteria bacterium]|nr:hypothetical protein [Candidatus Saccharibacteria bacterium]
MIIEDDIMPDSKWDCFDLEPGENVLPDFEIKVEDTINNYPKGYKVAITNPPYLSKNSATRRGLKYPDTDYDDIYKLCLDVMLRNTPYVAAIVPETFLTSRLFHKRLHSVISLTCKMFSDTDCPVCLALFVPEKEAPKSFDIYRMNELLGSYSELTANDVRDVLGIAWKFNDPNGEIGIWCIDNTREESIFFGRGEKISSGDIKNTSRSITRVGGFPEGINIDEFIDACNEILAKYRAGTKDVFMASFKGLRIDGLYRRRLDFATARRIMNLALFEVAKRVANNEKN